MKAALTVGLVIALILTGCSSSPETEVAKILGKTATDGGITGYALDDGELNVTINYTPFTSSMDYGSQLGNHLSSKLQKVFERVSAVKSISVVAYGPLIIDSLGNYEWTRAAEFTITRELYGKINWPNFDARALFRACGGRLAP
jgi:hypothetical protein